MAHLPAGKVWQSGLQRELTGDLADSPCLNLAINYVQMRYPSPVGADLQIAESYKLGGDG